MLSLLDPKTSDVSTDSDDEVVHWYCPDCYPDPDVKIRGFCGEDLTGVDKSEGNVDCKLCVMLDVCPKCCW